MSFIIAIDGPASSGKGTVAAQLAKILNFTYLESGAIYRGLALHSKNKNIAVADEDSLIASLTDFNLSFNDGKTLLNGEDITQEIRQEEIGNRASQISQHQNLRKNLLEYQRNFAQNNLVTDGRDMGSTVFPQANLKVFLTASVETRATRRYKQLLNNSICATIEPILQDIKKRDYDDSNRKVAPLCFDDSYKYLDNSELSIEETLKQILQWYNELH